MNINYQLVGQRIRTKRKQKILSQEQVAAMVGVGTSHISHIENGITKMSIQTLVNICNALDISTDELLCDSIYKAKEILTDEIATLLDGCSNDELLIIIDMIKLTRLAMNKNAQ